MKVYYDSNNSGGGWWLSDQQWKDLENDGWTVEWVKDNQTGFRRGERWLGALATTAWIEVESIDVAIAMWERVTGERAADAGCSCCGPPHSFYTRDQYRYWDGHDTDDSNGEWNDEY